MERIERVLVQGGKRQDSRTFDYQTLERIFLMAVERVREGDLVSKVIESCGFNLTTICKWFQAAQHTIANSPS